MTTYIKPEYLKHVIEERRDHAFMQIAEAFNDHVIDFLNEAFMKNKGIQYDANYERAVDEYNDRESQYMNREPEEYINDTGVRIDTGILKRAIHGEQRALSAVDTRVYGLIKEHREKIDPFFIKLHELLNRLYLRFRDHELTDQDYEEVAREYNEVLEGLNEILRAYGVEDDEMEERYREITQNIFSETNEEKEREIKTRVVPFPEKKR